MDRKENNATYYALRIDTRHRKQAYQSNGETAREMRGKNRLVHRFVRTAAFPGHKSANSPRSNRYIPALFSAAIVPTLNDPPTSSFARKKKILSTHFQLFASRAVEILPPLSASRNTSHQAFYPSSIVRLPSENEVHFTVNLCKFSCRMRDRNFYLESEIGKALNWLSKTIEGGNYFYLTSRRNIRNRYFQASLLFLKERSLSFDLPFLEINSY